MKAITICQPWATAIAIGAKTVETRSWATDYRGPIAIHAAKSCDFLDFIIDDETWAGVLHQHMGQTLGSIFPLGSFVATAELVSCRRVEDIDPDFLDEKRQHEGSRFSWTERELGNYARRRYGWILDNVRPLPEPVPYRGRQGLFEVPDELVLGGLS